MLPGSCLPSQVYSCARKFGCVWPSLNAAEDRLRWSGPLTPIERRLDVHHRREAGLRDRVEREVLRRRTSGSRRASGSRPSVPLSSESNGCAKYRPSAASPAAFSAGGDVHGSMPKSFAGVADRLERLEQARAGVRRVDVDHVRLVLDRRGGDRRQVRGVRRDRDGLDLDAGRLERRGDHAEAGELALRVVGVDDRRLLDARAPRPRTWRRPRCRRPRPRRTATAFGALLSTGVNGMPPRYGEVGALRRPGTRRARRCRRRRGSRSASCRRSGRRSAPEVAGWPSVAHGLELDRAGRRCRPCSR